MLAQINDLPKLELVHWVWIGVGFLALFVIVCTFISCKKVTPTKDVNDPQNIEIKTILTNEALIKIKSPSNQINCTKEGVEIEYTFKDAFEFAKSHPYFLFKYLDDSWMSRSDFFMNYDFKDQYMLNHALETNDKMPPIDKMERIKEIEILLKTNLLKVEKEELKRERINLLIELKKEWELGN